MQTVETIPLFRTTTAAPSASVRVAESAPTAAATVQIGDLTGYIGQDVDGATWAALQAECTRRYGGLWAMYADQVGDNYHVTSLHAKPE